MTNSPILWIAAAVAFVYVGNAVFDTPEQKKVRAAASAKLDRTSDCTLPSYIDYRAGRITSAQMNNVRRLCSIEANNP